MSEGIVKAEDRRLGALLSDKTVRFKVPRYQRGYSWEKEQWQTLWDDIAVAASISASRQHFLGSLILMEDENDRSILQIVDGQQRVATVTILLAAIRDAFDGLCPDDALQTHRDMIAGHHITTGKDNPRLELSKYDSQFFRSQVQTYPREPGVVRYGRRGRPRKSNRLIRSAYEFFADTIAAELSKLLDDEQRLKYLRGLYGIVTERLVVVATHVGTDLDAYYVFETLNDRGLDLSIADLLKNYLFSKTQSESEQAELTWDDTINLLGGINPQTFLRHYWISRERFVREKELYPAMRNSLKNKPEVLGFMEDLKDSAELYAALVNPTESYWQGDKQLCRLLRDLKDLGIRQCYPLLLCAHGKPGTTFRELVRTCLNLSVRHSVIGNQNPNQLEVAYSDAAAALRGTGKVRDALAKLRPLYPKDGVFRVAFESAELKSAKSAMYVLGRINTQMSEDAGMDPAELPDPNGLTLEHVLPESPDRQWQASFKKSNIQADRFIDEALHRIGNLTLLGPEFNKKAENRFIDYKRDHVYVRSQLKLNEDLKLVNEWDLAAIQKRQAVFASLAIRIWREAGLE